MNRELVTGLAQLSAEKGLPKEIVADIVGKAINRAYGPEENLDVKVDPQTGAMRIYVLKTAVEKVEDPKTQLTVAEAQTYRKDAVLGEVVPIEQSAQILGRIGAQAVKQVIQQSLREAEQTRQDALQRRESRSWEGCASLAPSGVTVNAHPCHCNHSARRSPCRATPRSSSWSST